MPAPSAADLVQLEADEVGRIPDRHSVLHHEIGPGAHPVVGPVGAGHLAGPDSVITMLRDNGYEVEGP